MRCVAFAGKLLPYLQAMNGEVSCVSPPNFEASFLVNCNTVVTWLVNLVRGALSKNDNDKSMQLLLLSGDPFTSLDFASRFKRSAMPADLGGELRNGEEGEGQPALHDGDALWAKYTHPPRTISAR